MENGNTKYWIWGLGAALVAIIIYIIWWNKKAKTAKQAIQAPANPNAATIVTDTANTPTAVKDLTPVLTVTGTTQNGALISQTKTI